MNLKGAYKDKFGGLRMWPKWKSLRKVRSDEYEPQKMTLSEVKEETGTRLREQLEEEESNERTPTEDGEEYRNAECNRCGDRSVHPAWQDVSWRPVVSYSRHHLKNLLGLAGRWSIYVVMSLGLGNYAGNPRTITEEVHRFNGGVRSPEEWAKAKREENEEKRRRVRRRPNERRRWREEPEQRKLRMTIWDLKSFFIKVPRSTFLEQTMPDVLRRLNEKYPGKPYY